MSKRAYMLRVRLSTRERRALDKLARERGTTASELVRGLIGQAVRGETDAAMMGLAAAMVTHALDRAISRVNGAATATTHATADDEERSIAPPEPRPLRRAPRRRLRGAR